MAKLGLEAGHMSLRDMQYAIKKHDKAQKATAKLPSIAKLAVTTTIGEVKAFAKAEKDASKKMDAYEALAKSLHAELAKETDAIKQAEIYRELNAASKSYAYSALALKTSDPKAYRAKRLLDKASE